MDRTSSAHRPAPTTADRSDQKSTRAIPSGDAVQVPGAAETRLPKRTELGQDEQAPTALGDLSGRHVARADSKAAATAPSTQRRDEILSEIRGLTQHYDRAVLAEDADASMGVEDVPAELESAKDEAPATRGDVIKAAKLQWKMFANQLDASDPASCAALTVLAYLAEHPHAPKALKELDDLLSRSHTGNIRALRDVITCTATIAPDEHDGLRIPLLRLIERETTRHAQGLRTLGEQGVAVIQALSEHLDMLDQQRASMVLIQVDQALGPFYPPVGRQ